MGIIVRFMCVGDKIHVVVSRGCGRGEGWEFFMGTMVYILLWVTCVGGGNTLADVFNIQNRWVMPL